MKAANAKKEQEAAEEKAAADKAAAEKAAAEKAEQQKANEASQQKAGGSHTVKAGTPFIVLRVQHMDKRGQLLE